MEAIESAFLNDAQRLNDKRRTQLLNRIEKAIKGGADEVQALQMPSQKEYKKLIRALITSSAKMGYLRADEEVKQLVKRYDSFSEEIEAVVGQEFTDEVAIPPELQAYLEQYALMITTITQDTAINAIKEILVAGLAAGIQTSELIEQITQKVDAVLGVGHATTIGRTEMGKMYNAGRIARYTSKENEGFVVALQYDAIVDTRTTHVCKHLDGMIVAIDRRDIIAEFTPPNHFQCRSVWLPVTKYETWKDNFDTSIPPEDGFSHSVDQSVIDSLAN